MCLNRNLFKVFFFEKGKDLAVNKISKKIEEELL